EEWSNAEATRNPLGPTTLQVRRVELTELTPDSVYEFGIGDDADDLAQRWRFRTMPTELSRPVTFVSGGDMMHTRAMVDRMNRQMQKLEPDFAVLGGDLAYANGVIGTRWIDWMESWFQHSVTEDKRLIPMVVAIGNHEVR